MDILRQQVLELDYSNKSKSLVFSTIGDRLASSTAFLLFTTVSMLFVNTKMKVLPRPIKKCGLKIMMMIIIPVVMVMMIIISVM